MLTLKEKRSGQYGQAWFTQIDTEKWIWLHTVLHYLASHDDLKLWPPRPSLQQYSDLDMKMLPLYACQIPSTMFYPFVTFIVRGSPGMPFGPIFIVPKSPLSRLEGKYWIDTLASWGWDLIGDIPERKDLLFGWMNADGTRLEHAEPLTYLDTVRLATSVKTNLLEDVRYVYDESQSSLDSHKTSTPNRHCFGGEVATFEATTAYLEWYIECFNSFFDKLIVWGKTDDAEKRLQCLIVGWTISRIVIDIITICRSDIPYIRKWQFFGLVDAFAALLKELYQFEISESDTFMMTLSMNFFENELLPTLEQIPTEIIRNTLIGHIRHQYESIAKMDDNDIYGPQLLWVYRNTRHGYTLEQRKKMDQQTILLKHSGSIPNDLPDIAIGLWHYVLLKFPFLT